MPSAERQPNPRRSWWVTLPLAVLAVVLFLLMDDQGGSLIPWWAALPLISVAYAVVEQWTLPVRQGQQTQSYSLAELPLSLGLLLTGPVVLLVGRMIGQWWALQVRRKQPVAKLTFNLALGAVETAVAVKVLSLIVDPADLLTRRGAYGLLVAIVVVDLVGNAGMTAVISVVEGSPRLGLYGPAVLTGLPPAIAVSAMGFLSVLVLSIDLWLLGPLAIVAALLVLAFRAHTTLEEQHTGLARVAGFTSTLGVDQATFSHITQLLEQARSVLDADQVELTIEGDANWYHLAGIPPEGLSGKTIKTSLPDVQRATVYRASRSSRRRSAPAHGAGIRDALVVPLSAGGNVAGTLVVANRRGELTTFANSDLGVAESVANHLAIAYANAHLADELRAQAKASEYRARHDNLTGLPNRSALLEHCHALAVDTEFNLLLLDLDRFKEVNDALGHTHGDDLLVQVGARLRQAVGTGPLITRLGGDEFAVVADGRPATGIRLAEQIIAALRRPFGLAGVEVVIGASIGVSHSPTHGSTTGDLLQRADIAMYKAKQADTGVEIYKLDDDQDSIRHLKLSTDLRSAIMNDELGVHFQPLVNLRTQAIEGFEALARWTHPTQGLVSPEDFIPMAERGGLIRDLTIHVTTQAAAACQRWRAQGLNAGVSVNLSARSLVDQSVPSALLDILRRHHLPPQALTVELTESSLIADPERAAPIISEMTSSGMKVAIDDFGTGYSSLAYLARMEIGVVKIDKSFIFDRRAPRGAAVVRSIIDLGHHLDMSVTAEGLETADDFSWLAASGCDTAQGFHIARPMPESDIPRFIARWTAPRPARLAAETEPSPNFVTS